MLAAMARKARGFAPSLPPGVSPQSADCGRRPALLRAACADTGVRASRGPDRCLGPRAAGCCLWGLPCAAGGARPAAAASRGGRGAGWPVRESRGHAVEPNLLGWLAGCVPKTRSRGPSKHALLAHNPSQTHHQLAGQCRMGSPWVPLPPRVPPALLQSWSAGKRAGQRAAALLPPPPPQPQKQPLPADR